MQAPYMLLILVSIKAEIGESGTEKSYYRNHACESDPKGIGGGPGPGPPPGARVARGQTPRAAPQGRDQPTQGAIPAFHTGCLDCPPELREAQRLPKPARATEAPASAHRHDMA